MLCFAEFRCECRKGGARELSDFVSDYLQSDYLHSIRKNTLLYHELAKVLSNLRQVSIDVIMLKGVYLADQIYDNIALRVMTIYLLFSSRVLSRLRCTCQLLSQQVQ